ncbi:P-loop containing nucleoside triphosphate hydrolase protein, partial [Peziza echinospora]
MPTIGLKLLYAGVNPEFDIVAVHGLNGDAYRTWTWKGPKKDDKEVLWLRDLLPAEIQDARIFTYGYDSIPTGVMSGVSTKYIHQHAQTFLEDLWAQRRGNEIKRPIIFIAHSLGGILVKQALIISSQSHAQHNEKLRSIITSTYGIMFMGTPHTGSDLARWGSVAESIISRMIPKAIVDTNPNLIKTLGRNSEVLQNITSGFVSIQSKHFFKLYYFWEEMKTKLPNGSYEAVVEYSSAVPEAAANIQSYGMHEEHSKMCRFQNDQDSGYLVIVRALIDWRDAAPDAIRRKWQQYIESVRLDALHSIEAGNAAGAGKAPLMLEGPSSLSSSLHESISDQQGQLVVQTPGTLLPSTVEPQFIVPHRPNEIFEGRRKELDELDQILKNSKKRRDGHASAVVSGISGSGKTHLIRQYVYEHRKEYPGGIFWIEAMSSATIGLGYWKIAMGLGLTTGTLGEPENTDQFVSLVLSWFRNNSKWLLVMDGADHETDEEIYSLKEVLPTGHDGAIIFTTVNHALAGTARLGSPEGLPLRDLEMDQCLAMLFKYARITNCTPEDKRDAEELVNGMDRLPLAIHSAGTYIKEMHIDIGRFLQYNKKHPRVDSLTSFHVILDQLEGRYPEAINLLYILSFVERKVPVRMLEWGIRHSQVALTAPDKKDAFGLSETISHLLSYSMVDRRSVVEIEDPGKVDMLFVHKVVQEICRQRMRADKALSYWLITCANLFCDSFRRMEQRRRDKYFSVSDYRRYQVHLLKINEHGRKYK